jgi:hypothetical protein
MYGQKDTSDYEVAKALILDLFESNFDSKQIDRIIFLTMEYGFIDFEVGPMVEKWARELEENDGEYLPNVEDED